jgi:hypothetical protein
MARNTPSTNGTAQSGFVSRLSSSSPLSSLTRLASGFWTFEKRLAAGLLAELPIYPNADTDMCQPGHLWGNLELHVRVPSQEGRFAHLPKEHVYAYGTPTERDTYVDVRLTFEQFILEMKCARANLSARRRRADRRRVEFGLSSLPDGVRRLGLLT